MNIKKFSLILLLPLLSHPVLASEDKSTLEAQRAHVIHQYIIDLGKADYSDIITLFKESGSVISTSQGKIDARQFFSNFLPEIESAKTDFHQYFISKDDPNHYAARFNFRFTLKDGEIGDGEYIDEFIFNDKSSQLEQVFMFENLKFKTDN